MQAVSNTPSCYSLVIPFSLAVHIKIPPTRQLWPSARSSRNRCKILGCREVHSLLVNARPAESAWIFTCLLRDAHPHQCLHACLWVWQWSPHRAHPSRVRSCRGFEFRTLKPISVMQRSSTSRLEFWLPNSSRNTQSSGFLKGTQRVSIIAHVIMWFWNPYNIGYLKGFPPPPAPFVRISSSL